MGTAGKERYGNAMSRVFFAVMLFVFSGFTALQYLQLKDLDAGKVESVTIWGPVKGVYSLIGTQDVFALSILSLAACAIFALRAKKAFEVVRSELGEEEYEQAKFENARAFAKARLPRGARLPAYLESKEALAAYHRRVKLWLTVLGIVFGTVGLAVAFMGGT